MKPLTVTVFPMQLSSQADAQGRAVTLVTTDAYKFYESVGFELVFSESVVGGATSGGGCDCWLPPPNFKEFAMPDIEVARP